ncbi:SusC/RagA family TonB-linked outer membrane protein [Sphingobacterium sp. UBA5670]|uniref:SusC/RagA family TonB-linked outer membrane protein n=1 Tax=Sphingobacterium sp. UBA5670 TaxID=1947502 RepID=UPI0025E18F98|nr:SusC/RagA family TonB-linked outer membrane protein [Sphingobacterium sp. UBA5670]
MKKLFLIIPMLLILSAFASAQDRITGYILDRQSKQPLVAVNVTIEKGKSSTTDRNGLFEIVVEHKEAQLSFSHIGYKSYVLNIVLPIKQPLEIILEANTNQLDEVEVTTGYQRMPKERATGSFAYVGKKQLDKMVTTNILERLPMMANGVMMEQGTSSEGNLMVRGLSTIKGPKSPLIVVDNFPYEGSINNINPNIVESITVLKDAAAASIWGARAANGVIVITTKNARANQPTRIDLKSALTIGRKPDLDYIKLISSSDFIDVETELFKRGFYDADYSSTNMPVLSPVVELFFKEKNGDIGADVVSAELNRLRGIDSRQHYRTYMYKPLVNQQYFLNISGGLDKYAWTSGIGYDANSGNLDEKYKRLNLRFQQVWQPISALKWLSSIYLTKGHTHSGRLGLGAVSLKNNGAPPYLEFADRQGNVLPVYTGYNQDFKSSFGDKLQDWNYYPLNDWQHDYSTSSQTEIILSTGIQYELFKGGNLDIKYQYQQVDGIADNMHDQDSYYSRDYVNRFAQLKSDGSYDYKIPVGAILDRTNNQNRTHNLRGQFNFDRSWEQHQLTLLLGGEFRKSKSTYESNRYYGYNKNNLTLALIDYVNTYPSLINGAATYIQNGTSMDERNTNFVSFFANGAYTWKGRYILSASARRDASNLFGLKTNDQWNPFWSAGIAWILSKEQFYQVDWLPSLKLRTTYGFSGNIDPSMVAVTTIAFDGTASRYTGGRTARFDNYYNPSLRWETSKMLNLAVDFNTKNDRLSGSIEYFIKNGENLFGTSPIDYTKGISTSMLFNVASMKGDGVDVDLNAVWLNKKLKWNTKLNMNYYRDKIKEYYMSNRTGSYYIGAGSVPISGAEGKPVYSIFAYKWAGLDPNTGDPQGWFDGQKSKNYASMMGAATTVDQLQYFGSAIPTIYGAMTNSFSYKGFGLDIALMYKFGYWFRRESINYNDLFYNLNGHADYAKRWQKSGDERSTDVPSNIWATNSSRDSFYKGSTVLVEKGDHIRLQYINLNYTLNGFKMGRLPFQSIQFYAIANNLGLLWKANKKGIDPDFNMGKYGLKTPSVYTIGLNANF